VDNRNLFVIDSSGRIVHRMTPFNELAQASYDELEAAVKKTLPKN
jgi:peroxiredoxin